MSLKVALMPGDGIGIEVAEAVVHIFSKLDVPVSWVKIELAQTAMGPNGEGVIPAEVIEQIRDLGVGLKGPTTTLSGTGQRSINVELRKRLGLFANVRPLKSVSALETRFKEIDFVIVRENIEDTYSGTEYLLSSNVAAGLKFVSRIGSEKCIRFAFEFARRENRERITCVHKANIHKLSDGMFLNAFEQISREYPEIQSDSLLVDNACMQLVTRPETFDVMVMQNLYGDILSDLGAGLIGGLGVAPAGNIGNDIAVFEAVHGSAPDIAGKGIANPTALLLSSLMMLRHLGLTNYADSILDGLLKSFEEKQTTRDLGGELSTMEFADAVVRLSKPLASSKGGVVHQKSSSSFSSIQQPSHSNIDSTSYGVDIYVVAGKRPKPVGEIGTLKLAAITNRGIRLDEIGEASDLADVYCLRYLSSEKLVLKDLEKLLSQLGEDGLKWVTCQKLLALE